LEWVATGERLRMHLVAPTARLAQHLSRELAVWHHGASVAISDRDYLPRGRTWASIELHPQHGASLPFFNAGHSGEPLLSLLGRLNHLRPDEFAVLQVLLRPVREFDWSHRLHAPDDADRAALRSALHDKSRQPGFDACLRILAVAPARSSAQRIVAQLQASLAPLDGPFNGLRAGVPPFDELTARMDLYERRIPIGGVRFWLTAREAAVLFHVPDVSPAAHPKLELLSGGALFPPPLILPSTGLLLGQSTLQQLPVYLPQQERVRHMLLLGPTGSGKTHALVSFVLQDIVAGRGCSLLTPSPDAIQRIVRRIPPDRLADVVLARFSDPDWSFGVNPLAQEGVEGWRVASELVAIWERLYPQFWGPLVSDILKHGVMALTERGPSSLLELVELMENPDFRRQVIPSIKDPMVRHYWERFDDLTLGRQEARTRSSLNKIRAPLIIPWLRRTLSMSNGLSFREILDQRKVVLWDLSNLADEGRLLGAMITSQYFQAALNRADLRESRRVPHVLYADEWQSWPTTAWSKGLDLLRQFGVGLVLAGQRLDQVSDELRQAALANVGSALVWGLRSDADAATMSKWLATTGLEPHDLKRLQRFQTYARVMIDGVPTAAISLDTLPLPPEIQNADVQEAQLWESSRNRYYEAASDIDRLLQKRFSDDTLDPQSRPRGRSRASRSS
jgi:hypothetical protein